MWLCVFLVHTQLDNPSVFRTIVITAFAIRTSVIHEQYNGKPGRRLYSKQHNKMDEFLGRDYVMVSEEGFEKYLEEMGLGYFKRKVAANLRPTQTLLRNQDGTFTFRVRSLSLFNWEMVFTPGVEFDASKPDGEKVKALITFEGNTMTHRQSDDQGRISTHVLVFSPTETVVTTTLEGSDIVAKRVYKLA